MMRCTVAARGVESSTLPLLTDSYDHFWLSPLGLTESHETLLEVLRSR